MPLRYEDRTRVTPIGVLMPGASAVVVGEVLGSEVIRSRRTMLVVRLGDGTGYMTLRFFYFRPRMRERFARGSRWMCFGEVRAGPGGLELVHPTVRMLPVGVEPPVESNLTPVYPTVSGLSQTLLRRAVAQALDALRGGRLAAYELPAGHRGWPTLLEAFEHLHQPAPGTSPLEPDNPARRRLAFDELLAHHLALRRVRSERRTTSAPMLEAGWDVSQRLCAALPFALTGAQRRAAQEIATDLNGVHPMRRLLQGDVGSGKTVVAALAVAQAVGAGWQAALMAPTELLAEQHYRTLRNWFEAAQIPLGLLTGSTSSAERREWLERAERGEPLALIGTQALISDDVTLSRLALAVIDEQHRFGVGQRMALAGNGDSAAHQLIMTATPIPRTLAMTLYADMDVSILTERPPGRVPVVTAVMGEGRRSELVIRIGEVVAQGRQVYWVCPLIEESEVLDARAAEETAAKLVKVLPKVRVALIHGRLPTADKDAIMRRFVAGSIDLLVATTVIEVGVDVPNATLMVIENAERLGLAQLHQLRGRVGRGAGQSHCVLLYRAPLSMRARERLEAVRASDDGFEIAEADLRLRGPGELVGTRQAGLTRLRVADLIRDRDLLARVPRYAEELDSDAGGEAERLARFWLGEDLRYAAA